MALSLFRGNGLPSVVIANPIFPTSPVEFNNGVGITLEVLERNSAVLKTLIGKERRYVFGTESFWARLDCLDLCDSTHQGLALLRDKETLKGLLVITRMEEIWFEQELEVFRTEIEAAIQFFHGYLTIHNVAGRKKAVSRLLNNRDFWSSSHLNVL